MVIRVIKLQISRVIGLLVNLGLLELLTHLAHHVSGF